MKDNKSLQRNLSKYKSKCYNRIVSQIKLIYIQGKRFLFMLQSAEHFGWILINAETKYKQIFSLIRFVIIPLLAAMLHINFIIIIKLDLVKSNMNAWVHNGRVTQDKSEGRKGVHCITAKTFNKQSE